MEIWPAYIHMHLQSCVRQGFPCAKTILPAGIHALVAGMHGCGVNTPSAAAVAAATCGFANDVHIPKGAIFAIGAASVIVAVGFPSLKTKGAFVAIKVDGAVPKVHMICAPLLTSILKTLPSFP